MRNPILDPSWSIFSSIIRSINQNSTIQLCSNLLTLSIFSCLETEWLGQINKAYKKPHTGSKPIKVADYDLHAGHAAFDWAWSSPILSLQISWCTHPRRRIYSLHSNVNNQTHTRSHLTLQPFLFCSALLYPDSLDHPRHACVPESKNLVRPSLVEIPFSTCNSSGRRL